MSECRARHEDGRVADMGGPYPELSLATPIDSPFVSSLARRHREMLRQAMAAEGFLPYPWEFWHFSRDDADAHLLAGREEPARFGPVYFDPAVGTVEPVADPCETLIAEADIAAVLECLLAEGQVGDDGWWPANSSDGSSA